MWKLILKLYLVCFMISCGSAKDVDIFQRMYDGQDIEGKAMCCDVLVSSARSCPGVIWRSSRLLVRASCIKYASDVYVQKGTSNCTMSNATITWTPLCNHDMCIRQVTAVYKHPRYPTTDLAMLDLNAPFFVERRAFTNDIEKLLDSWEKFIADYYVKSPDGTIHIRHTQMYTTPLRMFAMTVVLPTISFALFFLYIVFYTGPSDEALGITYTNLKNEGDLEDPCLQDVKCN